MIKLKLFILFIVLTSCSKSPMHVKLTDQAILSFSREVQYTNGLQLCATGGALFEDIKIFELSYRLEQEFNINEARELFINIAVRFLNKVNTDKEIQPYLHNYPVTINNLSLSISFEKDENFYQPNFIAYVAVCNMDPDRSTNRIFYAIYDQESDKLITVHEETYEEALDIIRHCILN